MSVSDSCYKLLKFGKMQPNHECAVKILVLVVYVHYICNQYLHGVAQSVVVSHVHANPWIELYFFVQY
jgi:hypothetical protein